MEVFEIIFIVFFTAIIISLSFIISQKIIMISMSKDIEMRVSIDINTAIRNLWKIPCSNSTEYSLKMSEINNLLNYQCSVLPCFINIPIPVFFVINYSNNLYRFGICNIDEKKCNIRKSYILIDSRDLAEIYTYLCYDDLSKFTITLQYNCIANKSFEFSFSSRVQNLKIKNNTICLKDVCNNIFCEKFLTNYELNDVNTIYFKINNGFYSVYKIS